MRSHLMLLVFVCVVILDDVGNFIAMASPPKWQKSRTYEP